MVGWRGRGLAVVDWASTGEPHCVNPSSALEKSPSHAHLASTWRVIHGLTPLGMFDGGAGRMDFLPHGSHVASAQLRSLC